MDKEINNKKYSNHELAKIYERKLGLMGIESNLEYELISSDRVILKKIKTKSLQVE